MSERDESDIERLFMTSCPIQFHSRSMSDPALSDIGCKNKTVFSTLNILRNLFFLNILIKYVECLLKKYLASYWGIAFITIAINACIIFIRELSHLLTLLHRVLHHVLHQYTQNNRIRWK